MRISSVGFASIVLLYLGNGCSSPSSFSDGGGGRGAGGAGGAGGTVGTDGGAATADGGASGAAAVDGGVSGHGGTGDAEPSDASGGVDAGDGGMSCSPACGVGSICVGTGTEGGAIKTANDAGVCPSGTHPTGTGSICTNDLSYACTPIPSGCNGTITCACASSLCPASHQCQGPSDEGLTCIEQVP